MVLDKDCLWLQGSTTWKRSFLKIASSSGTDKWFSCICWVGSLAPMGLTLSQPYLRTALYLAQGISPVLSQVAILAMLSKLQQTCCQQLPCPLSGPITHKAACWLALAKAPALESTALDGCPIPLGSSYLVSDFTQGWLAGGAGGNRCGTWLRPYPGTGTLKTGWPVPRGTTTKEKVSGAFGAPSPWCTARKVATCRMNWEEQRGEKLEEDQWPAEGLWEVRVGFTWSRRWTRGGHVFLAQQIQRAVVRYLKDLASRLRPSARPTVY